MSKMIIENSMSGAIQMLPVEDGMMTKISLLTVPHA